MPKMYNTGLREWRDIPEGDVQAAYESGQYVFSKEERVPVTLADGRHGTILGSEFRDVIRAGGSYDLPSERQERVDEKEYDSRNAEAFLLAAGRGLTFGLSDVALEKMGAYSDEEIQKLEDHNAILSGVGEIGGALLPAVFTGGGSVVAGAGLKGLLKRGIHHSPAGYATRSAAAAEAGVAKLLGVEGAVGASKMLRTVPGFVAAGGIEGALFGAGETFSEELLGRTDKSAEQIMGDVGMSALLGGGLAGAFSAVPAVVAKAFQSQAKTEYPKGLAKKVGELKDKYTAAMTGLDEEFLARTRDPKFLDDYLGFEDVEKGVNAASRDHLGEMFDAVRGSTKKVNQEKYRVFIPEVAPQTETETINAALDAVNFYMDDLAESLGRLGDPTKNSAAKLLLKEAKKVQDEIATSIQKRLHRAGYKGFKVRVNRRVVDGVRDPDYGTLQIFKYKRPKAGLLDAEGPMLRPGEKEFFKLAQIEGHLNQTVRAGLDPSSLHGTAKYIFRAVDQLKMGQSRLDSGMAGYGKLQGLLEDQALFGRAAEMQTTLNAAWSPLIQTQADFASQFMRKRKGTKDSYEPNSNKVASFLKNLNKRETSEHTRSQIFDRYTEAFDAYAVAAREVGLDLGTVAPRLESGARALREKWTDFGYLQAAKKEIEGLTRTSGVISETFATIGGYAFGGLPGALAARWVRNMASPGDAVRRRVLAHRMKSTVTKQIDTWAGNSSKRVLNNTYATMAEMKGAKRVSLLGLIGAKSTGNAEEDNQKEMEALARISSPEALAQKVEENLEPLADAPEISQHITANVIKGVTLYKDVVRQNSTMTTNPITGEQRVVISDAGGAVIGRARNTLFGRAIEQLNAEVSVGAVTDQTVTLTVAMYPELASQYAVKFGEELAQGYEKTGKKPDFQALALWGKLNQTQIVPTHIASALQAVHKAVEGQQDRPQRAGEAVAGLKGVANRNVLPVERAMT